MAAVVNNVKQAYQSIRNTGLLSRPTKPAATRHPTTTDESDGNHEQPPSYDHAMSNNYGITENDDLFSLPASSHSVHTITHHNHTSHATATRPHTDDRNAPSRARMNKLMSAFNDLANNNTVQTKLDEQAQRLGVAPTELLASLQATWHTMTDNVDEGSDVAQTAGDDSTTNGTVPADHRQLEDDYTSKQQQKDTDESTSDNDSDHTSDHEPVFRHTSTSVHTNGKTTAELNAIKFQRQQERQQANSKTKSKAIPKSAKQPRHNAEPTVTNKSPRKTKSVSPVKSPVKHSNGRSASKQQVKADAEVNGSVRKRTPTKPFTYDDAGVHNDEQPALEQPQFDDNTVEAKSHTRRSRTPARKSSGTRKYVRSGMYTKEKLVETRAAEREARTLMQQAADDAAATRRSSRRSGGSIELDVDQTNRAIDTDGTTNDSSTDDNAAMDTEVDEPVSVEQHAEPVDDDNEGVAAGAEIESPADKFSGKRKYVRSGMYTKEAKAAAKAAERAAEQSTTDTPAEKPAGSRRRKRGISVDVDEPEQIENADAAGNTVNSLSLRDITSAVQSADADFAKQDETAVEPTNSNELPAEVSIADNKQTKAKSNKVSQVVDEKVQDSNPPAHPESNVSNPPPAQQSSTNKSLQASSKEPIQLTSWYTHLHARQVDDNGNPYVLLKGTKIGAGPWSSGVITGIVDARTIVTASGRQYVLNGPINDKLAARLLAPDIVERFQDGFPTDWRQLLIDQVHRCAGMHEKLGDVYIDANVAEYERHQSAQNNVAVTKTPKSVKKSPTKGSKTAPAAVAAAAAVSTPKSVVKPGYTKSGKKIGRPPKTAKETAATAVADTLIPSAVATSHKRRRSVDEAQPFYATTDVDIATPKAARRSPHKRHKPSQAKSPTPVKPKSSKSVHKQRPSDNDNTDAEVRELDSLSAAYKSRSGRTSIKPINHWETERILNGMLVKGNVDTNQLTPLMLKTKSTYATPFG